MSVTAVLDWMVQDAHRLAECRHDHPYAVLGPQPHDGRMDRPGLDAGSRLRDPSGPMARSDDGTSPITPGCSRPI